MVVPDFDTDDGFILEGTDVIPTPMSDGKFNALMARSLLNFGKPYNDANKVEYNTLRRFMPSMG